MSTSRLAAALFVAAAGAAHADCPLNEAQLTGSVAGPDGQPVAGAIVEAVWDEKNSPGVSARGTTDDTGNFVLPIQYSTYSGRGITGTEKCAFALGEVIVKARREQDATFGMRVTVDTLAKPIAIVLR
jgi:hypothetical protein